MDEQTLYQRAQAMVGVTLGALATAQKVPLASRLHHDKGWVGQLIERQLGAIMGSAAGPDFPELGLELKTLPVDARGLPLEVTYVCTAPFQAAPASWRTSPVFAKIARILWIPVEASPGCPIGARRIGPPLLWSPDPAIEGILARDWEELSTALVLGQYQQLSSRQGVFLHIRPKAANSRTQSRQINEEGTVSDLVPRGFYLRRSLTTQIVQASYAHQAFFR